MANFEERVQQTQRDLEDAVEQAAADNERAREERLRIDAAASEAFARLLHEVSQALRSGRAKATTQRVKIPKYGVAKTKMGRFDFRTQALCGWAVDLPPHRVRLWIEVGGGHWTDGYGGGNEFNFARLRRVGDPAPIYACYQQDGSQRYRAIALSVLPSGVTWTAKTGFRLVYSHTAGRDGPTTRVDVDFEDVLARGVAELR